MVDSVFRQTNCKGIKCLNDSNQNRWGWRKKKDESHISSLGIWKMPESSQAAVTNTKTGCLNSGNSAGWSPTSRWQPAWCVVRTPSLASDSCPPTVSSHDLFLVQVWGTGAGRGCGVSPLVPLLTRTRLIKVRAPLPGRHLTLATSTWSCPQIQPHWGLGPQHIWGEKQFSPWKKNTLSLEKLNFSLFLYSRHCILPILSVLLPYNRQSQCIWVFEAPDLSGLCRILL